MDKGVYCLVLQNCACNIEIGRLGRRDFTPGWHVYVGSALGPGGLKRACRHVRLARTRDRAPKWHIDYLLVSPCFSLGALYCAPTGDAAECAVARGLGGACVPGFGCSDCRCGSHLFSRSCDPGGEIEAVLAGLGLECLRHAPQAHDPGP
ncbi:MAG: GIY-YIG nuclease family protein [Methanomicrobiaceae archaeon]|nr:GIY-YIG nuclease family protein [Methanomicrobiaceae archaeon]